MRETTNDYVETLMLSNEFFIFVMDQMTEKDEDLHSVESSEPFDEWW